MTTIQKIIDNVFNKGTKEKSWVDGNDYGIKAIDFRKPFRVRGIDNFNVHTIALYVYSGKLVCAIHGHNVDDIYCEEYVTYYCDKLSDETLNDIYNVVSTINKEDTFNA